MSEAVESVKSLSRRHQAPTLPEMDWVLLLVAAALVGLGFIMVASASMPIADRTFGDPFHFVYRHAAALAMAVAAAVGVLAVPIRFWERYGTLLFFVGLLLLVMVLIPGLGRKVNGATRWIPLGPINLQSSEFMKFFAVIFIAGYLVRRREEVENRFMGFFKPMVLIVIAATLIMAEPDFGTTAVLMATVLAMLFLGGVRIAYFGALVGAVVTAGVALVISSPYRMQRVMSYRDPWADPYDTGFQLSQALIAFGRGEWAGVGLGNGIQKQFFLPEAHTDFIIAVVGEELGLAGVLLVLVGFAFIVWRAFRIGFCARRAGRHFEAYLAQGFGLGLGLQGLINIGVNVGLLPTKGLTLPFMSYGSNSLIVACMIIAVLLRIDLEARRNPDGESSAGRVSWVRA
ncbi:MAG: putative lipid II flippase FtsW [Chromatiaceae bacterium]